MLSALLGLANFTVSIIAKFGTVASAPGQGQGGDYMPFSKTSPPFSQNTVPVLPDSQNKPIRYPSAATNSLMEGPMPRKRRFT